MRTEEQTHKISRGQEEMTTTNENKRFVHSPLKPGYIRILRILPTTKPGDIRCSLEHRKVIDRDEVNYLRAYQVHLDLESEAEQPPLEDRYTALSYCWADPTPAADIEVDGKLFGVTRNLYDFFQQWATNEIQRAAVATEEWQ